MLLIKAGALSPNMHTHANLCRIFSGQSPYIYAAAIQQHIFLLCNITKQNRSALMGELKPWFQKSAYSCGVSYNFTCLASLPTAGRQATIAMEAGRRTPGSINDIDHFIIPWLMDVLNESTDGVFIHPALNTLQDYDRLHKSDYYATLFTYLQNERNHMATAARLNIHRNTLFHRLERLEEYFDIQMDTPDQRFRLLLSFYMEAHRHPQH